MFTRKLKLAVGWIALLFLLLAGSLFFLLNASLPITNGEITMPGLNATVTVNADELGIPSIIAQDRHDAFRVLGYLHARDRLFQMDLMRRKSAGRLAEIFGIKAVNLDRFQRDYQFEQTAKAIVSALPPGQRSVLKAYITGVNTFISQTRIFAPEFIALNYRPEPWREEDSILVELGMFQTLNGQEQDERMVSVMEKALPPSLVKFLTPDTDLYATVLMGGNESHRPAQPIPVSEFSALNTPTMTVAKGGVDADSSIAGSNNWVVGGSKTADGRAIIANDMHLGLTVPNIWYRTELRYAGHYLNGVTLPGLPLQVVGGNRHVAWGFTNVTADLIDLISLEINPENHQEYLTPQGWRDFSKTSALIKVKDGDDVPIKLRSTIWGPVSSQSLLGKPVAIKWTALEAGAVDLGLMDMDSVASTQEAMAVINQAGGPPQNVVFADRSGHIGWTYMGRLPKRKGFDGLVSKSWADETIAWDGFIPSEELPHLYDPPAGFIVTANHRTLGRDYSYVLGYNWSLSYRAYRITELLQPASGITEQDMLRIQLDSRSEVFEFYQQLALEALKRSPVKQAEMTRVEKAIRAWDGYMHSNSQGAALLVAFRATLAEGVFAKIVARCRQLEPNFRYAWREMETPLRQLLLHRPKGVLPTQYHDDWNVFILEALNSVTKKFAQKYPEMDPATLNWGTVNLIKQQHPFSRTLPMLATFLDIAEFESGGCASFCVKVMSNHHASSERLVLSPAHPEDGILEMPGGQSGHLLSGHYRDQQQFWQAGEVTSFQPKQALTTLYFQP